MNLVYRRFTRFDADRIPNISTFSRNFALLGEDGTRKIHERVAELAQEEGVTRGNRLRTDTTVIETNIHHPSDSSLLGDGIRVLTRALIRIRSEVEAGAVSITDHARATTRRIIEISRAARGTPASTTNWPGTSRPTSSRSTSSSTACRPTRSRRSCTVRTPSRTDGGCARSSRSSSRARCSMCRSRPPSAARSSRARR